MVGLRHALVAALAGAALLAPATVEAQLGRTGRTEDTRRDGCSLAERTRRAGDIILGRDGRRTNDCRDTDTRRDGRVEDCGIIIIGDRRDCRIRDDRDRRDGRVDSRNRGRRVKRGPAFCRSGAGHPVHGRRWCREKGYPLGSDRLDRRDRRRDDDWDWDDDRRRDRDRGTIFRLPDSRRRGVLDRGDLIDILGSRTFSQVDQLRRRHGLRQGLQGRWYRDRLGRDAILISAGTVPIADLVNRGRGYELQFRLR
ncbi:MAG TPA: hypothetical protein VK837_10535 [Longimicrobiales bacterium]|nr:hypothetical protein [Longimicrobiales bacterium]